MDKNDERQNNTQKIDEMLLELLDNFRTKNNEKDETGKKIKQKQDIYYIIKDIADFNDHPNKIDDEADRYLNRFQDLFNKGYKRDYCDIYDAIIKVTANNSKDEVDILSQKLDIFYESALHSKYTLTNREDILKMINYTMLECRRFRDHVDESKQIKHINEIQDKTERISNKFEQQQNQSITVFTIFSAVTITFFGGIKMGGDILASLNNCSKYKLVFCILLTGFVVFNTVFMLLYVISKMTEKNINIKCKYYENKQDIFESYKKCGAGFCSKPRKKDKFINICVFKNKYTYMFYFNAIILIGLGLTLVMWFFDIHQFPIKY